MKWLSGTTIPLFFAFAAGAASAERPGEMFILHDLSTSPAEAAAAVRRHVEENADWLFLAEFPLKGGEVLALKICYLPLGGDIFAAGMHVAAMMPCGNLAFYEEDGQARLSMLDLRFMTELNPDPNLERAVERGAPAFEAMLAEVLE